MALRVCRATNHLKATLLSGFTTIRDLGTEGAGYADVGLKQAVEQKIIPGPRMLVVDAGHRRHAQLRPARLRPGDRGYRRGRRRPTARRCGAWCATRSAAAPTGSRSTPTPGTPKKAPSPTFSEEELKLIVETARLAGCPVAAHAMTKEGMRRAALAGVETIEHGNGGDIEVFRLMAKSGVALCPTLAAAEAMSKYRGWKPGRAGAGGARSRSVRSFKEALEAGVTIVNGSDMGVFAHGDGARELELLVEYGMKPPEALRSATSVAAKALHLDDRSARSSRGCWPT